MIKVAYTVTCAIEKKEKAREWLAWLRGGHIQDVVAHGAESAQIVAYKEEGRYEVRYIFPDRATYDSYILNHAPRLREEGLKRFPPEDGFAYGRIVGEIMPAP
ncbi:MAG: DUF4286 family protein [Proteobacteria bacterium]|nr:DUF4286 family protein [Pseudomonadota bacterium]